MLLSVWPEASELVELIPAVNELTYKVTCNLVRHARTNTVTCGNANVEAGPKVAATTLSSVCLFVSLYFGVAAVASFV